MDNIADEQPVDIDLDEYLHKFETIETHNNTLRNILTTLPHRVEQDHKVSVIIKFIQEQQQLNDNMYNLLIEMNNYVAKCNDK